MDNKKNQGGITIENGGKDLQYFTIVPNIVLDALDHWDREVYIQIKRTAGENGEMWRSEASLAKQCCMSRDRLRKSIASLIKGGLIEVKQGEKITPSKFNPLGIGSKRYRISDIWSRNLDFYTGKKNLSPDDKLAPEPVVEGISNLSSSISEPVVRHTEGKTETGKTGKENPPYVPPEGKGILGAGDPGFLDFWAAFPRKTAKPSALRAWRTLKPSAATQALMLADIAKRKTSDTWVRDGGQFIMHPATYLNQRRWEDQEPEAPSAQAKGRMTMDDIRRRAKEIEASNKQK